jgi:hypothetical protein
MASWTSQPGHPLVRVAITPNGSVDALCPRRPCQLLSDCAVERMLLGRSM